MFQTKASAWPTTGTAYGIKGAFFPTFLLCRAILDPTAVSTYVKMKGKQVKRPSVMGAKVTRNVDAMYELSLYTSLVIDDRGDSAREVLRDQEPNGWISDSLEESSMVHEARRCVCITRPCRDSI